MYTPTAAAQRVHRLARRQRRGRASWQQLVTRAVVAPPETALEKGGPGATYGNGAVAKVGAGIEVSDSRQMWEVLLEIMQRTGSGAEMCMQSVMACQQPT